MSKSNDYFTQAKAFIPGGVNSPVRAYQAVDGTPPFIQRGEAAYIFDVDGNRYIDYVCSWGALVLGHAHPKVVQAVKQAANNGLSFGAPIEAETQLAQKICELIPSIEKIRFVNSGTEATMSAIRLARGFTKRNKIIKFEGCYHGHSDTLLVKAGSGGLTFGVPSSLGVPEDCTKHTLIADFNDLASVKRLCVKYPDDIAAVIIEPVAGNMNCVLPSDGFLQGLRQLCDDYQSLLIFDEVITGFRVGPYSAQQLYNVTPDLTTLGKVIGGGMPVGAFGGRADIMNKLAPLGSVYQAGTLSGNPIAMAAGIANINEVTKPGFYEELSRKTKRLIDGMLAAAKSEEINITANITGGMYGIFFTDQTQIATYQDVMNCNTKQFKHFFHAMLKRCIYLAPSAYESGFMSAAHTDNDIDATIAAAKDAFSEIRMKVSTESP